AGVDEGPGLRAPSPTSGLEQALHSRAVFRDAPGLVVEGGVDDHGATRRGACVGSGIGEITDDGDDFMGFEGARLQVPPHQPEDPMTGAPQGASRCASYVPTGTGDEHVHVSSRSGPFPTTTSPKDHQFGRVCPSGAGTPRVGGHWRRRPVIMATGKPHKLVALN